jgi:hypothetical protein
LEAVTLEFVIDIASRFGLAGAILVIWYFDGRRLDRSQEQHRKDVSEVLSQYRADMAEIRRMYENNVLLVKSYEKLAVDLHDVVIMNTQAFTHLAEDIEKNQFCPMVRLTKQSPGDIVR